MTLEAAEPEPDGSQPLSASRGGSDQETLGARVATLVTESPALVPGLLCVGVFLAWSTSRGGLLPVSWYPGALFVLGLVAVTAIATGVRLGALPRTLQGALLCFALFTVWNFCSITWAQDRGDAWDGANRTLLYFLVFALFAAFRWRRRGAVIVLGAFALGVAVIGGVELVQALSASSLADFFIGDRFSAPVGYPNGSAALWLSGFWPAVFLASRVETPWPIRGLMLGAAGLLFELAVLVQSRGSALTFPIVLVLYFVLVPGRLRSLVVMLPLAVAILASLGTLLHVFDAGNSGAAVSGPFHDAARVIAISAVALVMAGAAIGAADRRISIPERSIRRLSLATGVLSAAGLLVLIVLAASAIGNPGDWLDARWKDFKSGYSGNVGGTRFVGSLGSNRYDFWRVSLDQLMDHPVGGAGSDNFLIDYLRERRSNEVTQYPHSLPFRLLGETGGVGALLFAGFMALALLASARVRERDGPTAAVVGVALVGFLYWFVHGSADWFWEIPALAGPAFAWLGLADGLASTGHPRIDSAILPAAASPSRRLSVAAAAGVAALALVAAIVSLAPPWIAARQVDAAASSWRADPAQAFDGLRSAAAVNPLSSEADLVAGAIANRLDRPARARTYFAAALRRNPDDWYAHLQLGVLAAQAGHRSEALSMLREARRLYPTQSLLRRLIRRVEAGRSVSVQRIDRFLLRRVW